MTKSDFISYILKNILLKKDEMSNVMKYSKEFIDSLLKTYMDVSLKNNDIEDYIIYFYTYKLLCNDWDITDIFNEFMVDKDNMSLLMDLKEIEQGTYYEKFNNYLIEKGF